MTTSACTLLLFTAFLASATTQNQQGLQSNDHASRDALYSRPAGQALSPHEDDALREKRAGGGSLGMFPRVGRDPDVKSRVERAAGLHVFPRIGRSPPSNVFPRLLRNLGLGTFPRIGRAGLAMFPRVGRGGLAAFPRLGRGPSRLGVFPRVGRDPDMQREERALAKFPRIGRSGEELDLDQDSDLIDEQESNGLLDDEQVTEKRFEHVISVPQRNQPYFFPASTKMSYPRFGFDDDDQEDETWFDEPLPIVHESNAKTEVKRGSDDEGRLWFGPRLGRKRRDVKIQLQPKHTSMHRDVTSPHQHGALVA